MPGSLEAKDGGLTAVRGMADAPWPSKPPSGTRQDKDALQAAEAITVERASGRAERASQSRWRRLCDAWRR
jgi:hypothetical protein